MTRLDDSMILFLASLPEEEYKCVLEIFQMYEDCEIEGQKISQAKRRKSCRAKIDCKGSYFKPLRGLDETNRIELLDKVIGKEISFKEVAEMSRYAKKMREVKAAFMSYHQLPTWNKAVEKFPDHTKKERLETFMDLVFKKNNIPPAFLSFCQHSKQCKMKPRDGGGGEVIKFNDVVATMSCLNVLSEDTTTEKVLGTLSTSFVGFHLTLLDPPEVHMLLLTWISVLPAI